MSEEDSDNDSEDERKEVMEDSFDVSDIPQAFSHFTYRYSKRWLLVCDLQGVLSTNPPLFELTDPVIHFMSRRKQKHVFGRTDRGWDGRDDLFRTHQCSSLCRMINQKWVRRLGDDERLSHIAGLDKPVRTSERLKRKRKRKMSCDV